MELDTSDVDIHAMLASVLNLQQAQARAIAACASNSIAPADIGTEPGDERRLKQVIFSLISNALKFTPAGGTVTLAAYRADRRVALVVADTGVGVAAEDQARIFAEKFLSAAVRGNRAPVSASPSSKASSNCMAARSSCNRKPARAPPSLAGSTPSCRKRSCRRCARWGSATRRDGHVVQSLREVSDALRCRAFLLPA